MNDKQGKKRRFCSRGCATSYRQRGKLLVKRVEIRCLNCQKELVVKINEGREFCSSSCGTSYKNKQRAFVKNLRCICLYCNEEFVYKRYGNARPRKFCSHSCHVSHRNREWQEKGMKKLKFTSSLEDKFANFLDQENISYQRQVFIEGLNHPFDFKINGDTLVEIDGDYWHNVEKFPNKNEQDRREEKFAVKNGYYVFRFSESNIKENFNEIKEYFIGNQYGTNDLRS